MMNAAVLMGMDSCPIEGFDKDKVEAYLEEKGVLDTSEFGVSVMCAFGYRDEEIKPKSSLEYRKYLRSNRLKFLHINEISVQ